MVALCIMTSKVTYHHRHQYYYYYYYYDDKLNIISTKEQLSKCFQWTEDVLQGWWGGV